MLLHMLKYDFKIMMKNKSLLFWLIAFPIILGSFFHLAFSSIFDTEFQTEAIPVIIIDDEGAEKLSDIMGQVESDGETLFKTEMLSYDKAMKKISDNDAEAALDPKSLKLYMSPDGSSISQTIVKQFIDSYRINTSIITEAYQKDPSKASDVTERLMSDISLIKSGELTEGSLNIFDQYYYNLVAMVAFYGSLIGLSTACRNQANLSAAAARKASSPLRKSTAAASGLLSAFFAESICVVSSISYIIFVLGENLGKELPLVYLGGIAGGMTGVSIGYFIGSVGSLPENKKSSIITAFTMTCCFLSGLMDAGMKLKIEENVPILNHINPLALISDMFYCLNIYSDHKQYLINLVSVLAVSAVFCALTFIFTRRKKYASI